MKRFPLVLPLVFLSLFIFYPTLVQAGPSGRELSPIQRLEELLRDLEAIEKDGRQILENQDAMISEIQSLKIWTRKR